MDKKVLEMAIADEKRRKKKPGRKWPSNGTQPTFTFLPEWTQEPKWESLLFSVTQLRPHPNPLSKGEGVNYDGPAHCEIISGLLTSPLTM